MLRAAAFAFAVLAPVGGFAQDAFRFVAIGDMPYSIPGDYAKFDRLINRINRDAKPRLTLHIGDIKSGSTPCSDENFAKVREQFDRIEGALVYTPGDNEWTDCHRANNGGFDPRERLARIRQMFFADPAKSLGQAPLAVESQSRVMGEKFATFVENVRFAINGVQFVTVHIVGSNNGFEPHDRQAANEFFDRDAANIAWIDAAFAKAKADGAKALVIAAQADLHDIQQRWPAVPSASGFIGTLRAIERGSKAFGAPVLYVHGDEHRFVIDRMLGTNLKPIPHVTRLQVYGAAQVHGVVVDVDPSRPGVFGFTPLIVPENGEF